MAGHSVDDYLETVYFLAFPIGEYQPATGSSAIAARVAEMLGVSRASAGEMLKRLEADGLVERGEHKEAILTPAGIERAEHVVRKHRMIERFLTDFMGYTAAESHVHADELGDTFTDDMIERIAERLGSPGSLPARLARGHERSSSSRTASSLPSPSSQAGDQRDDRSARRARRRSPPLVLRAGPRARLARDGGVGRRDDDARGRRRGEARRRESRRRAVRAARLGGCRSGREAGGLAQRVCAVRPLPRELRLLAAEVAVRSRRPCRSAAGGRGRG